eukprot:2787891-Rhodomonas_salina.1
MAPRRVRRHVRLSLQLAAASYPVVAHKAHSGRRGRADVGWLVGSTLALESDRSSQRPFVW